MPWRMGSLRPLRHRLPDLTMRRKCINSLAAKPNYSGSRVAKDLIDVSSPMLRKNVNDYRARSMVQRTGSSMTSPTSTLEQCDASSLSRQVAMRSLRQCRTTSPLTAYWIFKKVQRRHLVATKGRQDFAQ
ncbi:hypothetical protein K523DRAFT_348871 [Schizophyllum commune Tattone D]|nr:hypothetical protein K523DRAFT_348871 [Schizophyllum commune Tattone D]